MIGFQKSGFRKHYTFTSESVAEGHPDKVCDQVADAILDAMLAENPQARVAVEILATTNHMTIAGEVRGVKKTGKAEMEAIARGVVRDIGYDQEGFHWEKMQVLNLVHEQSADIAKGVDAADKKDEGAGDQGIMFGYACNDTPDYMPAPILYAHDILKSLAKARKSGECPELGPDAKSQVSLEYVDGEPVRATAIVVSTQHKEGVSQQRIREIVREHVTQVLPKGWMPPEEAFYVNPTGSFIIGGPDGDTGLTGRKIIVDTYGGFAMHGGGSFSGKDPTKVDRSAAYAARYLAKNVVAAGLAARCTIQISYAIGVSKPVSFFLTTHGTGEVDEEKLEKVLPELMDLSPRGIRTHLGLNRPIYRATAAYGHFGRTPRPDGSFSWEKIDLVEELRKRFNLKAA